MSSVATIYPLEEGPLAGLYLLSDDDSLVSLRFITSHEEREHMSTHLESDHMDHPLHRQAHEQLNGYFSGRRRDFDLPVSAVGTDFQQRVWREIEAIPYGKVLTYGQVAGKLGSSGLSRAVGQAANRNPIPLIIPCHRVVGAGGKLTGFASGVELKSYLLSHERRDRLW